MAAISLWIIISTLLLKNCFGQICLSGNMSAEAPPMLPEFPDQFSTEIEANIRYLNLTLRVTEYYDSINNRGRIDSYSSFGVGMNTTLVDYDTMEVSHIVTSADGSKSCFAASLAANSSRFARSLFGAQFDNGTAHIVTSAEFLGFGADLNRTYLGVDIVRGIPCHRWQSCNITAGSRTNYTIDYFFTANNWNYYPSMIPVQIVVNGTRPDNSTDDESPIHQVYNVYSFINFRPGPADDDVFRVPPGLPCMGRITGKPLPPLPNDYYSITYESIDQLSSRIMYFKVYYIFSQGLYRVDLNIGFPNATTLIEDFNEGVQYYINRRYGTCSISPISAANSTAVAEYSNGTLHLEGLRELFLRRNESTYSYEGVSQVRDVDTESWISLRDYQVLNNRRTLTNGYIQVYYTQDTWNITSSFGSSSNTPVPWEYVVSGTFSYRLYNGTTVTYNTTNRYHLLDYQSTEPDFDVFDASICFGVDQYTYLSLTLPLPAGTPLTSLDHTQLKSKVRMALSNAVNIPASRIGGIHIYQRTNNSIVVSLHVLDAPPHSIRRNILSRDEIVSQLMDKVNSGMVTITLGQVTIQPSLRYQNATTCSEDDDDGVGVGVVVGLSIALFIVGLLVGIIASFLLQWFVKLSKNRYKVSSYNKHQDEVINN